MTQSDSQKQKSDLAIGNFSKTLKPLLQNYSENDLKLIEKAFNLAKKLHQDQKRISGENYFSHPLSVAKNIAKLSADAETISAALLHDTLEDCDISAANLENYFGQEITYLVDGVTKISSIGMKNKVLGLEFSKNQFGNQIDSYRKLLTAMAEDPRVLIIKLYDRLHNIQTLEWLPENRRRFYALETIEIYAALAERIGMATIKSELEDLAFPYAFPEKYENFIQNITIAKNEREKYIKKIIKILAKHFPKEKIYGRAKHNFSLYNKLIEKGSIKEIFDLVAVRIITENIADCYEILGQVQEIFLPIEGKFYDYISKPRNGIYQSLHTTVIGPENIIFEIQIRTKDMQKTAEFGIAAHWFYKEKKLSKISEKSAADWFTEIKNIDPVKSKKKFFSDKIFVFSPRGKIIGLSKGATPLDFAFFIHSNLGLSAAGAKVNGKMVSISSRLKNGDIVEILKNDRIKPSRDWLRFVRTNYARGKIREYFVDLERPKYFTLGLNLINLELEKLNKPPISEKDMKKLSDLFSSSKFPFNDFSSAVVGIGKKDFSKNEIIKLLYPEIQFSDTRKIKFHPNNISVHFEIGSGFAYRLANCCKPKIGNEILGYITLQKEISVHKTSCRETGRFDKERIIVASWR